MLELCDLHEVTTVSLRLNTRSARDGESVDVGTVLSLCSLCLLSSLALNLLHYVLFFVVFFFFGVFPLLLLLFADLV